MMHTQIDLSSAGGALGADDIIQMLSSRGADLEGLQRTAAELRDEGLREFGRPQAITYSKKVFIPVTRLCRDRCHYCAFVETPGRLRRQGKDLFISEDQALAIAMRGERLGCREALLTLGDRPEDRWPEARQWLDEHGFESTIHYVSHLARRIIEETTLLPHANPGVMSASEMSSLRQFAPSLGMMLETTSERLWSEPGQVHFGSPDKDPALRLQVLEDAGQLGVPFTSGALIGIGETLQERAETLMALRDVHRRYGNLQEVIIQNFLPKDGTPASGVHPVDTEEYLAAIATARIVLGPVAHLQAPPNLSDPETLVALINSGIDDWGGVSPLTADHVNPERPWPQLDRLAQLTRDAGYTLTERLTIYPEFVTDAETWVDSALRENVLRLADGFGLAQSQTISDSARAPDVSRKAHPLIAISELLDAAAEGAEALAPEDFARLLAAEPDDLTRLFSIADDLRKYTVGDCTTYVRNHAMSLNVPPAEVPDPATLAAELEARGIVELCIQGVLDEPGNLDLTLAFVTGVSSAAPSVHLHAFRPGDVLRLSRRSGVAAREIYSALWDAGVRTVTGTGLKLLDETWRLQHAPDDLPIAEWRSVIEGAHELGLKSTAVIGLVSEQSPLQIVHHLFELRSMQRATGGFTELIPLPVAGWRPIVPGRAPELDLRAVTAVARLILGSDLTHIQVPWPRVERHEVASLLTAGADDLGGTLERWGEPDDPGSEFSVSEMAPIAKSLARTLRMRNAWYGHPDAGR
ncbi:7,8-didemethyl-8-hydroxy-5-deazariboflavin synthase CofG [Leucobacter sp. Z1108]|uniref:7,8-didemethyl-8-hydroxy-5-deazariboflavin synthase CofG n=1 Tax=Leucobacter sp. Z1108 TaxID=3439066 RepID=UPI003F2A3863